MTTKLHCPTDAEHLAPTAPNAVKLEWQEWDGSRFRSHFASCTLCDPWLIYEWGTLGGRFRIRRTDMRTLSVHVTPETKVKTAARWWQALLAGKAI